MKPKDILENVLEKKRLTPANSGLHQYHIIPRDATEEHAKNCTNAFRLYFVILYILLGMYLPCGFSTKIDFEYWLDFKPVEILQNGSLIIYTKEVWFSCFEL